jgi:cytochrome c biogenesis protein CcdA
MIKIKNKVILGIWGVFRKVGETVASIVNFIVLLIVYCIGIGITSLVMKTFGKKFLDLGTAQKDSYWIKARVVKEPLSRYYRQF